MHAVRRNLSKCEIEAGLAGDRRGAKRRLVERLRSDVRHAPITSRHLGAERIFALIPPHPPGTPHMARRALALALVLGLALAGRAEPRVPPPLLPRLGEVRVAVRHEEDVVLRRGEEPVLEQGEVAEVGLPEVVEDVADYGDDADDDIEEDVEDLG